MPALSARERLDRMDKRDLRVSEIIDRAGICQARYYQIMSHAKPYKPRRPTKRQIEVLQLIAQGKESSEIAVELGIALKTIEKHRDLLYKNLGAHNVAQVIVAGFRKRLIKLRNNASSR